MGSKKPRQYTAEFKREAVERAAQPGQTIVGTAKNSGVPVSALAKWQSALSPVTGKAISLSG